MNLWRRPCRGHTLPSVSSGHGHWYDIRFGVVGWREAIGIGRRAVTDTVSRWRYQIIRHDQAPKQNIIVLAQSAYDTLISPNCLMDTTSYCADVIEMSNVGLSSNCPMDGIELANECLRTGQWMSSKCLMDVFETSNGCLLLTIINLQPFSII